MNRFKGLDLVNSMLEELWTEVQNIVQEAENKTIPQKRKSKNAKWLSEDALQIAEERSGKKERKGKICPTNTGFQRIVKRDKNDVFSEQCTKIEENNRRGKTRDCFRKIGTIQGTKMPKMGMVMDRNG